MPPLHVFLVDDHPIIRYGLRHALQAEHDLAVIGEAENGEAACALLPSQQPDVLLLDLRLSGMNGLEVTRHVRRQYPNIKILILTGREDEESQRKAFEAGADGYLLKSASVEEIIGAIRAIASGHAVISPLKNVASPPTHTDNLSERELEVLALTSRGVSNKEIAQHLNISDRTVQTHLTRIYQKIQVTSRTEAVLYALARGWVTATDYEI